jgi:AcrR family transcriptional regulator
MATGTSPDDRATPDAILDAAESLFAHQGFAATTIKQLAAAAHCNSALLYYYFTDKAGLYDAVLSRMVGRVIAMGRAALADDHDPALAIRAILAGQGRLMQQHPAAVQLIGRELLAGASSRAGAPIRQLAAQLFTRLCAVIRRGQETGVFRADIDPRFAAISLIGQQSYFYFAAPAVGILLAEEGGALDDATRRAFASHVAAFSLQALSARSPE